MTLRCTPTPPGRGSAPQRTNNLPSIATTSVTKTIDLTDFSLINSLQAQLSQAQSDLAQAQASLAIAQAQIAADAVTIANLQGQVASLQAQVASLQAQVTTLSNPLYSRFIIASIIEVGGGIYVPPSYDDPIISLTKVNTYETAKSITTTGGGYP